MAKEGYKPTSGMQSAARRAIKLKEQGKAKGAGTVVGWTRAGQLARGETLSLSTVKRMYSYFSRHEVDKKGKDWDNAENPSNGKIMWLAWGGDAGFSWSKKIVEREKNMKKSLEVQEIIEEIKDILDDIVNPAEKIVEIQDDTVRKSMDIIDKEISETYESEDEEEDKWDNVTKACWSGYTQRGMKDKDGRMVPNCVPVEKVEKMNNDIEKAVKPEISKEMLLEVIKELQELIVGMIEIEEEEPEDENESETPKMEITTANPSPIGDPEKNDVNWPVEKIEGQLILSNEERAILEQEHLNEQGQVRKSNWDQMFDPTSFNKRTF